MKRDFSSVVYCVDGNELYRGMALVSLYSLLKVFTGSTVFVIYERGHGPSEREMAILNKIHSMNGKVSIRCGEMPAQYDLTLAALGNVTPLGTMCCARILLPDLLPNEGQCLYADSDVLFLKDPVEELSKWYNDGFRHASTAGVKDMFSVTKMTGEGSINGLSWYSNSGILLMDFDLWRSEHLTQRCLYELLTRYHRFADQDTINLICRPIQLPSTMNLISGWINFDVPLRDYNRTNDTDYDSYGEVVSDACVLHYTGRTKPYAYGNSEGNVPSKLKSFFDPFFSTYGEYVSLIGKENETEWWKNAR